MQILWFIIELSATAFENYVILNSLNYYFKPRGRYVLIPFWGAMVLTTGYVTVINQIHIFEGFLSAVTISLFILYALLFLEGKTLMKVIMVLIAFSLILGINMLVANAIAAILNIELLTEGDSVRLIALFLTKILFFAAMKIIVKLFKKEGFTLKSPELFAAAVMLVLTHVIAVILIAVQMNENNAEQLTFIAILSTILTDIFIIYMMRKISKDNKNTLRISLLELQLSEQKQMSEDAGQISKEIKKAEHDLKHHLLSVLGTLENGDTQEAEEYLRTLLKEYETSIFKYISLENSAINSVLNFKIGRCRANGIDFKLEIESDFAGFDDTDICVLLSNLLDNAIEASQLVPESPMITLTVTNKQNYLCILVRNRIMESVLAKNKQLKTTKQNKKNHGLGLYSVSQIVDKYEGMKNFYEKNGYFVADIWLKQSIQSIEERIAQEEIYQTRQI